MKPTAKPSKNPPRDCEDVPDDSNDIINDNLVLMYVFINVTKSGMARGTLESMVGLASKDTH